MPEYSIYKDIAERTGGDIYVGVVGPVRSGKSTFIKKFMEAVVLPNIGEGYSRDRARDELPQSAAGKTVMTTEPKFIPEDAVPVVLDNNDTALCFFCYFVLCEGVFESINCLCISVKLCAAIITVNYEVV